MWRSVFVACAACSRLVVSAPDRGSADCTSRSIAPAVDLALVVVTAAASLAATEYMFAHTSGPGYEGALIGSVLVDAIPFGFYGSEQYAQRAMAGCRELRLDRVASARELARRGKAAAANGDCLAATRYGAAIRELDPATFGEYAADPGVVACSR